MSEIRLNLFPRPEIRGRDLMVFLKEITSYTGKTYNSHEVYVFVEKLGNVGVNERHMTIIIILLTRFVYFKENLDVTPNLLLFIAYYHADGMLYDNPLDLKKVLQNLGLPVTREEFIDIALDFAIKIKWKLEISLSPQAWNTVWDFLLHPYDINQLIYKLCFIFKAWDNIHQNELFDEKFPLEKYKLSMCMLNFYYNRAVNLNHPLINKASE